MTQASKKMAPKRSDAHKANEESKRYGDRDPDNLTIPTPPVGTQPPPSRGGCGDDDQ